MLFEAAHDLLHGGSLLRIVTERTHHEASAQVASKVLAERPSDIIIAAAPRSVGLIRPHRQVYPMNPDHSSKSQAAAGS